MPILSSKKAANWWPLNPVSGEQFIAGKTLRELQEERLPAQGNQYENTWIIPSDWERLKAHPLGTVLLDAENSPLGFLGDTPLEATLPAACESFTLLYPWHLLTINERLLSELSESQHHGEVSPAAVIEGHLIVGKGTRILPGVFIEGNAIIGENCKIGPNCYIRGNTSIGDNAHIGQAVEIKNSLIGHGSCIGHLGYVGDSVIGNNVNFGAGTITSNLRHDGLNHRTVVDEKLVCTGRRKFGTIVGDNVHTGIHTSIYPGRKLGSGTSTRPNTAVEKDLL